MAAPDMPHPARAPQRPQNSAEFHHDEDGDELLLLLFLGGSTAGGGGEDDGPAFLSLNFRGVVVLDHCDCTVLLFRTGARSRNRRNVVLEDDACRDVAGERRNRPRIIVGN
jgi:hypothetical protein